MQARQKLGCAALTWAFLISNSTNGITADYANTLADIKAFVKDGGILTISYGGASGPFIETVTPTAEALFAIFDQVIQETGTKRLDFDVEGAAVGDKATITKRINALKLLQNKYPDIIVSYTLACRIPDTWGNGTLPDEAIAILKETNAAGIKVSYVNTMVFDFYSSTRTGSMGDTIIKCAESLHSQLSALYPGASSSEIYGMMGLTMMIGKGDDGVITSVADAQVVTDYVKKNQVGLLSFWALQRDQKNTGDLGIYSQVNTENFQFYNVCKQAVTNTPPSQVTPPATTSKPAPSVPVPAKPTTSTDTVWTLGKSYKIGDVVTYNNAKYTCTASHVAVSTPNLWKPTSADPVAGGGTGSSSWSSSSVLYKTGQTVTYNGVSYKCLQNHTSMTGWDPVNVPALWSKI